MRYVIYLDVFFVINTIMDLILLKVASHFLKLKTTLLRCLIGAILGSLMATCSLLLSYENMLMHMLFTYILTAAVMVFVTYGKTDIKSFATRVGWLYLVTVVLGGAMNLIYNYTYFGYVVQGILRSVYNNPLSICRFLTFTGGAYLFLNGVFRLWDLYRNRPRYVTAVLILKGKKLELIAFIDTGNTLKCPYNGKPVHIVTYKVMDVLLEGVDIFSEKYRLVPYNSLGRKNGLVEVIECDEIFVYDNYQRGNDMRYEQKKVHNLLYYEKYPNIGLYRGEISGSKPTQMLLNGVVAQECV